MRASRAAVICALLVLGACSGSTGTPTVPDAAQPGGQDEAGSLVPVAVLGNGLAIDAASADGAGGLVVTSIGVNLIGGDGAEVRVPTTVDTRSARVLMAADARHGVVTDYQTTELWSLGPAPSLIQRFEGATPVGFARDGSALVTSTPEAVTSTSLDPDIESHVVLEAPEGAVLGPATMSSDGATIAAQVSGVDADFVIRRDGQDPATVDVFSDSAMHVDDLRVTDDGGRLLMQTNAGDPFARGLASWNARTSSLEWDLGPDEMGDEVSWTVGADGRVLLADPSRLRIVGTDGTIGPDQPLDASGRRPIVAATAQHYAMTSGDGVVRFLGLDGTSTGAVFDAGRPVVSLDPVVSADGVISVDASGVVRTIAGNGDTIWTSEAYRSSAVNDVALSSDDADIAYVSTDGAVTIGSTEHPDALRFTQPEGSVDAVTFSPDGELLVTAVAQRLSDVAFDDTISFWNPGDATLLTAFGGEGEDVNGCANFRAGVAFSPDGSQLATASHDFSVNIHDADGSLHTTLPPGSSTILDLAFSPDGQRLVTTSDDGYVRVWDTDSYDLVREFIGPPGGYWSIAFSSDGSTLVASDITGSLRSIDVESGAETMTFEGTTTRTGRFAMSPDGSLVAGATDGTAIGIWSTSTGELLSTTDGHHMAVTSAVFSSDGSELITGSGDGTVRVWAVT